MPIRRFALPTRWRAGPDADLSHLPVSFDVNAVSASEGVRAALSVAVIVAVNEWLAVPALAEAALGALLTCLADPGGPVRRRIPALFAFLVLGTLATSGFGLVREAGVLPATLVGSAWIFCTMFARAWGPAPMQVGNLLAVVAVLALERGTRFGVAVELGAMFAAGSAWSLALSLVIWRIHPFGPARRAVADVFRRVAVLAADISTQLAGDSKPDWAAHARAHRRYVRDGIEAARTEVLAAVRGRGQAPRGNALLIQIEAADQTFGTTLALSDILEEGDGAARAAALRILPALQLFLNTVADAIVRNRPQDESARPVFERLLAEIAHGLGNPALAGVTAALLERLRVAAMMTMPEGEAVEGTPPSERPSPSKALLAPLLANMRWSSAALRHAVRACAVAGPALLFTAPGSGGYAQWLTITLVLTLQPFFALTWQRALERVVGTVLGGVAAAVIAAFVQSPIGTAALLFPLTIAAFTVRRVSLGLFMAAMTPIVVLLSELGQPGTSELTIALYRAGYTIAGGTMAVIGSLILWPSWEPARVRTELQGAIRAHAAYADAELAVLMGEGSPDQAEAARRAAGVASNTLETTLARALQEPTRSSRDEIQAALLADAALRRIAGRLAALQYTPGLVGSADAASWRAWLAEAFAALERGDAPPSPAPPAEAGGALARIARQIALIDGALRPASGARPTTPSPQSPP